MNDKYGLDGHKLKYHVDRLNDWLKGNTIYPVLIEVSPTGSCNHRCVFCAMDFMEYEPRALRSDIFITRLEELAGLGLKSIVYAGEGEPLMHPHVADFLRRGKDLGIHAGVASNGALLGPELAEEIMPVTEWIKLSIDAADAETHAALHGCRIGDFERICDNLKNAAEMKHRNSFKCALGVQFIILPDNVGQAVKLAKMARDWGMSYFVAKPYSHHPQTIGNRYKGVTYRPDAELSRRLSELSTASFSAVYRANAVAKVANKSRSYDRCLGLPFWSYIDSAGNVWGCSCFLKDDRFLYGNIHESAFKDIWEGHRRRQSLEWVASELDVHQCRPQCRLDEINQYLWDLKHPPPHASFI